MTSKEIVFNTLNGTNRGRTARQLWLLPWAQEHYPEELKNIIETFPADFGGTWAPLKQTGIEKGDPCAIGEYIDPWGCKFTNIQKGVIGEVKEPLVKDDEWEDADNVHVPEEWLTFDVAEANRNMEPVKDLFVFGGCCPRPFEQLQFIRGTENLMMDLMFKPKKFMEFLEKMHDFYCRLMKKWAETDVDALQMMDDWGSQKSLLISPALWNEIFRPMYQDYIDIAHKAGKKIFMHSDGYTLSIIPCLIDMGLDAFNTQIFCMGMDALKQFKGKITFWGEVDRQYLIPRGTKQEIQEAVKRVYDNLYDNGYCIAQCEFGPAGNPNNVYTVFETWDQLTR